MTFSGLLLMLFVTTFLVGAFIRKPLRCYVTMVAAAAGMLLWAWVYGDALVAVLAASAVLAVLLNAFSAYARYDLERVTAEPEPQQH